MKQFIYIVFVVVVVIFIALTHLYEKMLFGKDDDFSAVDDVVPNAKEKRIDYC